MNNYFAHEWHNVTTVHPFALVALVIFCLIVFAMHRKQALLAIFVFTSCIPSAQRLVVFGLDFTLIRILIIIGLVRIVVRGELKRVSWNTLDKLVVAMLLVVTLAHVLLRGTFGAFVFKLGFLVDTLGAYIIFRVFIKTWDDFNFFIKGMTILSVALASFFILEKMTGKNMFYIFGGVPEFTTLRHGKLRAQGAYSSYITAGCFWATMIPLFVSQWWHNKSYKFYLMLAVISSMIIVFACASSTPLVGAFTAGFGLAMIHFRKNIKQIRLLAIGALAGLHLVMAGPVWHLVARIDLVGGSTGYHRYLLIDQAIHRVREWFLLGTVSTAHWGHYLFDTANQYVAVAVDGGAASLLLFVLILTFSFKYVGRLLNNCEINKLHYMVPWGLGVSLFTHCVIFIGVSYFHQS
jgi:hypothetical protein